MGEVYTSRGARCQNEVIRGLKGGARCWAELGLFPEVQPESRSPKVTPDMHQQRRNQIGTAKSQDIRRRHADPEGVDEVVNTPPDEVTTVVIVFE